MSGNVQPGESECSDVDISEVHKATLAKSGDGDQLQVEGSMGGQSKQQRLSGRQLVLLCSYWVCGAPVEGRFIHSTTALFLDSEITF